jgi:dTDP-4-amino-4,6-dideoxygalactose transaminase
LAGSWIIVFASELIAAFLWAQLEQAQRITAERVAIWHRYHDVLADLEREKLLRRPVVPAECSHNGHLYYVLLAPEIDRQKLLDEFKKNKIGAVFHYVPLHSSPAGIRHGRAHGDLEFTDSLSQRLVRLPLWMGLTQAQQERACDVLQRAVRTAH